MRSLRNWTHSYIPKKAIISDATLNERVTDFQASALVRLKRHYLPRCGNQQAWSSSRRVWRSSGILSRSPSSRRQRKTSGYRGGTARSGWRRGTGCTTSHLWSSWRSSNLLGRCLGLWCWRPSYCATAVSPPLYLREKYSAPVLQQTDPRSNPAPHSTELNKSPAVREKHRDRADVGREDVQNRFSFRFCMKAPK